jgi:hypothetical protein
MRHSGVCWSASGFVSILKEGLMINDLGVFGFDRLACIANVVVSN